MQAEGPQARGAVGWRVADAGSHCMQAGDRPTSVLRGGTAWSACGQRARHNGVTPRTTCMYCRRSGRFPQTKIELLRRVSAVR